MRDSVSRYVFLIMLILYLCLITSHVGVPFLISVIHESEVIADLDSDSESGSVLAMLAIPPMGRSQGQRMPGLSNASQACSSSNATS
jgi:hypothetical protein